MAKRGPVSVQVEGAEEAIRSIGATELRLRGRMRRAVGKTLVKGLAEMKRTLSRGGSGRLYTRGGVSHRASAPGEAPAVDRGQYRASWHERQAAVGLNGELYTDQARAEALEYGRKDRTLKARPHAGPVSEYMAGEFKKESRQALSLRGAD